MTNSPEKENQFLQDEMGLELEEAELDLEELDEDEINDEIDEELEDDEAGDDEPVAPTREDLDTEERLAIIVGAADDIKASDIVALDLRGLTIIADYFVICTGKSSIQIRGIADRIEEKMRDRGYRKLRMEGYQEATWILLDFGDVVAHIMAEEQRAFYRLEEFWAEAPHVELGLIPEPTTLAASFPVTT